jgi:hydrogenase/urease accessory protein HupE
MTYYRIARIAACVSLCFAATRVAAHPLAPSMLSIHERENDTVEVEWRTPAAAQRGLLLEPVFPPDCADRTPKQQRQEGTAVVERWTLRCERPSLAERTLRIRDAEYSRTSVLLRLELADGRVVREVMRPGQAAFTVPARVSSAQVAMSYLGLGLEHITTGWDHLVFVLGLVLLAARLMPLLATATAFTAGHSLTLALSVLGLAAPPEGPIEVLIAVSILVLAVRLASPAGTRRAGGGIRWSLACCFGLLHGFGFAGALREVGLPSEELPLALAAFNVGIELGQLVVIAVAFPAILWLARRPVVADRILRVSAYGIGSLASFWMLQRL